MGDLRTAGSDFETRCSRTDHTIDTLTPHTFSARADSQTVLIDMLREATDRQGEGGRRSACYSASNHRRQRWRERKKKMDHYRTDRAGASHEAMCVCARVSKQARGLSATDTVVLHSRVTRDTIHSLVIEKKIHPSDFPLRIWINVYRAQNKPCPPGLPPPPVPHAMLHHQHAPQVQLL